MTEQERNDLIASSILAWITLNKFVNEGLKPIEFENHRFLIDYLADDAQIKVTKKAAQIGLTVAETLDNFYLNKYRGMNVIHTLQTKDVIKGFVFPKVNPIINNNPAIKSSVTMDSEGLKQVGDFFTYYRGANAESQAINISADVLKIDEYDRSNPQVVAMFPSRLDASPYAWRRFFSNPSMVGFGVDRLYEESNQFHWLVKCSHCGHDWFMDWDKPQDSSDLNHYVDKDKAIYACGKCGGEIYDNNRRDGKWVAKYPSRKVHGYWFSQLMAPWFSAEKLIDKFNSMPIDVFYNMTLGKAYTPKNMYIDRSAILRATAPSNIARVNVVIGVDQDAQGQYFVCMTPEGVFDHGFVDSWEKIEHMKLMYNAVVVCDPAPYPTMPKKMAMKYKDWYMCYFKEMKGVDTIEFKGSVVYADRTRVIDIVANEINEAKILFRQRPQEMEDTMIKHWLRLYRTTEEKEDGKTKSTWIKEGGKQSDYPFALTYARIGLSKVISGGSQFVEPDYSQTNAITTIHSVNKDGIITTDMSGIIKETMAQFDE